MEILAGDEVVDGQHNIKRIADSNLMINFGLLSHCHKISNANLIINIDTGTASNVI